MKVILPAFLAGALMASPAFAGGALKSEGQSSDLGINQSGASPQAGLSGDSDQIRQAQQKLHEQGYAVGEIDGKLGPQTRQAVQAFQRDHNLSGNGTLDQQTIAALGDSTESSPAGAAEQQAEIPGNGSAGSPADPSSEMSREPANEGSASPSQDSNIQ